MLTAAMAMASCSSETLMSIWNGDNIQFNIEAEPLVPDSGALATRATKQTSISSFKVYAYDASGNTVIDGATYTKNSSGTWTSSTSTEWPSGNVTFYAFSPGDNSAVSFSTSTKQLTYTAPTAQGSQQDVLYAYTVSSRPTNNTVTLTFSHANAAFSVNARLASGCTASVNVSGVSLANVKPTNTLTMTNGTASASGSNITSTLDVSAKTLTTSNQAISSSPLIIPPQSVTAWAGNNAISSQTGAYLAVTCKISQDDKYVVGSATTNGTVYVPMSKALTQGQDNSVNLVFGNEENGARCYGRDANGNRITVSGGTTPTAPDDDGILVDECTENELGYLICYDGRDPALTSSSRIGTDMPVVYSKEKLDELHNYYGDNLRLYAFAMVAYVGDDKVIGVPLFEAPDFVENYYAYSTVTYEQAKNFISIDSNNESQYCPYYYISPTEKGAGNTDALYTLNYGKAPKIPTYNDMINIFNAFGATQSAIEISNCELNNKLVSNGGEAYLSASFIGNSPDENCYWTSTSFDDGTNFVFGMAGTNAVIYMGIANTAKFRVRPIFEYSLSE